MDDSRFSQAFCFIHESGDELYPIRVRNKDTGIARFRVAEIRIKKSDRDGFEEEVEEEVMIRRVLTCNFRVRMETLPGVSPKRNGGYRDGVPGSSIVEVRPISDFAWQCWQNRGQWHRIPSSAR